MIKRSVVLGLAITLVLAFASFYLTKRVGLFTSENLVLTSDSENFGVVNCCGKCHFRCDPVIVAHHASRRRHGIDMQSWQHHPIHAPASPE